MSVSEVRSYSDRRGSALGLLGVEIDASRVQWLAVLNVLLGSFVLLVPPATDASWVGGWASTAVFVSVYTCTIGGCLSSLAGWMLAREVRTSRIGLLSRGRRHPEVAVALSALPAVLWMSVSIGVVWCIALARTYLVNDYVRDVSVMVILTFAATVALMSLGFLLGTVLPRLIGLVSAAVAPWFLVFTGDFLLTNGQARWSQLGVFFVDQAWSPSLVPDRWEVLFYSAYVASLALTIYAATIGRFWSRRRGFQRWRIAWVPVCLTAILAVILVINWRPGQLTIPNQADLECQTYETTVTVCLWPDQLYQLDTWQSAVEEYGTRVEPLDTGQVQFVPLGQASEDGDREIALSGSPREADILQAMLATELAEWNERCRAEMSGEAWREFVTTLLGGESSSQDVPSSGENSSAYGDRLSQLVAPCS